MKKGLLMPAFGLVLVMLLLIGAGLASANDSQPGEPALTAAEALAVNVTGAIPIQGRLTDAGGAPLNGSYTLAFRLYDVPTAGAALCSDSKNVTIANGLFSTEVTGNCLSSHVSGQQLYLGIEVNGNGEMTPRTPIYPVPYAWSLRPGSQSVASLPSNALLHLDNTGSGGRGLRSYASSTSGENWGVVGASRSPEGTGGFFYNNAGGVGLEASSSAGTALKVTGSGVIQSSATSTVWISGNQMRPKNANDSTIINMDDAGGAMISRGAVEGNKTVVLPVTLPGQLYGQNVTLIGLDIYYVTDVPVHGIQSITLRRRDLPCFSSYCYVVMLNDSTFRGCPESLNPFGCSRHFDLTTNNALSSDAGILYLVFELQFLNGTGWVDISGISLTLQHN